ncbi:MAG: energy-coupling factor transporter transmembrane protein EcfT [Ruminococcaceae bacterium]|nr:energy-coupling factor transporter transmembrane protein EcfT [Oscillospiraceae bacterium]
MLSDITLGQYFPIDSPLHKLDPRTKILSLIAIIVAIFLAGSKISYAVCSVFILGVILMSGVPFKMYFKSLKPIWFVILFTAVLNMFLTQGEIVYVFGIKTYIKYEGIYLAIKMAIRLVLLILVSSALTYTTSPIALTDGVESLLKPLSKIGFPAHELAMMMSIAIRFIPTLIEETEKIIKAQKARGGGFDSGSLIKKVKALIPMLIPLFVSAFRRADDLAFAMEARCYRGGANRTRLKQIHYKKADFFAAAIVVLFLGIMIAISFFGV